MIPILGEDSYRGFSAWINEVNPAANEGAQPLFVGRLQWASGATPSDAVIKLYETGTCGVANEMIGFVANHYCGVNQPQKGAALILPADALPPMTIDVSPFVDRDTGLTLCWATSLEQNAKPFRFMRKLSSFSEKQVQAFYKSKFCRTLAGVDHISGNNDRHEGNFLYVDDLNYMALDQGAIGGGGFWHTLWPDDMASNELLRLVQTDLKTSQITSWYAQALTEYHQTREAWERVNAALPSVLHGLLDHGPIATIIDYMRSRSSGTQFEATCGALC